MSEYRERRNSDAKKEAIVHQWLEKYLWDKFPDYQSNDNVARQKQGVDCEFTGKSGFHYICDEKAVTGERYINTPHTLPTFCLELSMRTNIRNTNNWVRMDGWMLNENEVNNCFALVWVDKTHSGSITSVDDIIEAEVVIVKKDAIWDYIHSKGWDEDRLRNQIQYVLNNPEEFETKKLVDGLYFSHPKKLINAEAPVNICIYRNDYRKMADFNKVYKIA